MWDQNTISLTVYVGKILSFYLYIEITFQNSLWDIYGIFYTPIVLSHNLMGGKSLNILPIKSSKVHNSMHHYLILKLVIINLKRTTAIARYSPKVLLCYTFESLL